VCLINVHLQELARQKNYLLDLRIALSSEIDKMQPNLALIKGYMGASKRCISRLMMGLRCLELGPLRWWRRMVEKQRVRESGFEKV
jgi:hypothetical protein